MNKLLATLVLFLFTAVSYCQEVIYDSNAEHRPVAAFTSIDLSGTITLYLSQGTETGVAISAGDQKYNSKIKTEVHGGVLKISVDGGTWNTFGLSNQKLKAYVSVKDITRLGVSGASMVIISGSIAADALNIGITGASEVKGNITVTHLNLDITGASVARLGGTATDALIDATGAARVYSYNLKADKCNANSTGASTIRITVNKELNADASGGASISYRGEGVTGIINASSGASIKKRTGSGD
ncbi:MAG: hypothetical protein JWQ96_1407 [Segetibacter sp.]|nr:hypothetical protein [Segetibacter sp.]